ncbi:glycosyltransferase [Wenzhouxiangella sp. EGI_FJ10305]|uniref:glycosyltransferase n=1 Tax=Wenzhouxiangella sp. EGI_FJ10305 TaxID=3243768 RepID=UPI0035E36078
MSTLKMGRRFAELGHSVGVFSFSNHGHDVCEFGKLHHATEPGGHYLSGNLDALQEALLSFQPDIVINQMPYEHEIGQLLKENKRYLLLGCLRNTLYSVRGNIQGYVARTAPGPLKRLSRWRLVQQAFLALHRKRHRADLLKILDTYDRFIMFGPPNLEELRYFVPDFREDKIRLIPNSIPEVAPTPPKKQKRLLWLGRVAHQQKRAELILPIWARVSEALPDWELDIVGDGPLLDHLQREAKELSLPRIYFHGRQVPDEFYRRAAIFFMTSAFEGFPNTLVEAQSQAAIPVIFDSYPVARWIVQDGASGALVPPFDVDAMADEIIELAESPDRARFAEQALESARRFHIDRVGQLWQELFEVEAPKYARADRAERLVNVQ